MPKNFFEFAEYSRQFDGIAEMLQVDVMDGKFVPEISWPYIDAGALGDSFKEIISNERRLPEIKSLAYELDLMIETPEKAFESWVHTGAKRLIFHIESVVDQDWFWKQISHIRNPAPEFGSFGVEIGVAINTTTPNEDIYENIPNVDFVQCMGIEKIGFQGQSFNEQVLPKIEDLRKRHPELIISVDGGVSLKTAGRLIKAGANRLVVGSAILKSEDIKKTVKEFQSL